MSVVNAWQGAVTGTTARVVANVTGTSVRLTLSTSPDLSAPVNWGPYTPTLGVISANLSSLSPSTRYWWAIEDDGALDTTFTGTFQTLPVVGTPTSFTWVCSGCAGGIAEYPGEGAVLASTRMSNHPVFDTIRQLNPAMFFHVGDLHYYDLGSGNHGIVGGGSLANYRRAYDDVLLQQRQHQLYREVPLAYVWDDHDYGPDNSDGTLATKANAQQVFRERVPHYTLPDANAVYQSFTYGRVLFVLTDTRSYRSPSTDPASPSKTMLGAAQKTWLDGLLSSSSAELLVWMNPTPWMGASSDTWAGYTHERDELMQMFSDHGWLDKMCINSSDHHALAIDTGANNAWGGFPVFQFGSLDTPATGELTQYDLGSSVGNNRYGTMQVVDRGYEIDVIGTGWIGEQQWKQHKFTVTTSTPFITNFPADAAPWQVEIAPGADLLQPESWQWQEITDFVRYGSGISISAGRRDEGQQVDTTTCSMTLDNRDGRFSPRNPLGPYFGQLARNTPIRVRWATSTDVFTGFVAEWPPRWDLTANDSTAPIQAAGIMRRLAQGTKAANSALWREIMSPSRTGAVAYWPCEDAEKSTSIASAITGHEPMAIRGVPNLAESNEILASDPLPTMGTASFTGNVKLYTPSNQTVVRAMVHIPVAGTTQEAPLLTVICDSTTFVIKNTGASASTPLGGLRLQIYDPSGALLHDTSAILFDTYGTKFSLSLDLVQNGANIDWKVLVVKVTDAGFTAGNNWFGTLNSRTVGRVTRVIAAANRDHSTVTMGHVTVANSGLLFLNTAAALVGHVRETAADRITRLCKEEAIPFALDGSPTNSVKMGAQRSNTVMELLREAERTDGGVLYEAGGGLAYLTREARSNQPVTLTLDKALGQVAAAPEPTDDDQAIRNDVTASRVSGSIARFIDNVSVVREGRYDESVEVSLPDDSTLVDHASWRVHLGTVDELRWPVVSVNLARNPALIPTWLNLKLGDRLRVEHALTQLPGVDVDLLVDGWTMMLKPKEWTLALNCAPASPWDVAVLENPAATDAVPDRLDTDGSVLDDAATDIATSLLVATNAPDAPAWLLGTFVDPATIPRVVDSFNRTSVNTWGTSETGQAWTTSGGAAANFDCDAAKGKVALTPVNVRHFTTVNQTFTDIDMTARVACPVTATGGSIAAGFTARHTDDANHYLLQILFGTTGVTQFQLFKRVANAYTQLGSTFTGPAYTPGLVMRIRFQIVGTALRARIWTGSVEPLDWDVQAVDTQFSSGKVGTHSNLTSAVSNPLPVTLEYDNFVVAAPDEPRFDVRMGGERVTVSEIATVASDTFTRSASNGWGTATSGQAWSVSGGAASDFSVTTNLGRVSLGTINVRRFTNLAGDYTDVELVGSLALPGITVAAGGSIDIGPMLRWTDDNNFYVFQLLHQTDGTIQLRITKRFGGGSFLLLGLLGSARRYFGGSITWFRVQAIGTRLAARIWTDGEIEPAGWQVVATDNTHTRGRVGTHSNLTASVSNPLPVLVNYDTFTVTNPQRLTVARSVNGIVKAQAAGTDVRLWKPATLDL